MLSEILSDSYKILEAENGQEALDILEQNKDDIQLILLDVMMPVMDGYEATMRIRKLPNRIRANIPVIALTANAVPENRERAVVVGMDDFLVKPANSARLLRSLVKFL